VLAWLAGLGLLCLAGVWLSAATLNALRRTPAAASAQASDSETRLRKTYRAVLWLCCTYYYLSIPLVLAVVVLGAAALVIACLALGWIPVKALVLVGCVALATLVAVLKGLFRRRRDVAPGTALDLESAPRFAETLEEVARKIGTRPVDTVYLTTGTEFAVMERGGLVQQLRGKTERCLILGLGVLEGMDVGALKAVLAHEYGHFRNEDTAGGGFALSVRRSLMLTAVHLVESGAASVLNPAWWFVRGFGLVFLRISQGASRLQEVLADRWAAHAYGAEAFVRGLRHVIERDVRFDAHMHATLNEVVNKKLPLANLYAYAPQKMASERALAETLEEKLSAKPSPYDSHPSPEARIEAVRALETEDAEREPGDEEEAWGLFPNRDELEENETAEVRGRLAAKGWNVAAA
jgi:Zn-dependent protease with chaperone function